MSENSLFWRPDDEPLELAKNYRFASRFKLSELLGKGGFGQVWRANDSLLGQEVALKISVGDLTKETIFLRRLPKDRYVSIFDFVKDDGVSACAYSMELLETPWMTIEEYALKHLKQNYKDSARAAGAIRMVILITVDILASLSVLHGKKRGKNNRMVHADIKPQNLYINQKEAKQALKQQWGSVRSFTKIGDLGLTCPSGSLLWGAGTPGYMPPEQQMGGRSLSPAADLYAIGQTIAYMLTGSPFDVDTLKHVNRIGAELREAIASEYIVEKLSFAIRKMTMTTPVLRGDTRESIALLENILPSDEDWKILAFFMSLPPGGLNLNETADALFDDLKLGMRWANKTTDRIKTIKQMVGSLYKRKILSRDGHNYSVRVFGKNS